MRALTPDPRIPRLLARIHLASQPGDEVALDPLSGVPDGDATRLAIGAGFERVRRKPLSFVRVRSLPDTVGRGMRLLTVGLNPSEYAADAGVGYARPGNRFWPAIREAGIEAPDRDPFGLLAAGIGMTDLVKRATRRAAELDTGEYVDGVARVEWLCRWLRPDVVCFVGLAGWRSVIDKRAAPGWQPRPFGTRPAYVMPSTSGLNAHARLDDLAQHLSTALRGPPSPPGGVAPQPNDG